MPSARRPRKTPAHLDEAALYAYAVNSLARQMRSISDLKRLMRNKVEPGDAGEAKMSAVIGRLEDQRYLDDTVFATAYTRLRQENQGFGRRRVQQELIRKGIHSDLIAATLESAYENVSEEDLARRYLARKRIGQPGNDKETARVVRRLVGAGFSFATVSSILKRWKIENWELDASGDDQGGPDDQSG